MNKIIFPVQCKCGRLILEKYMLPKKDKNGNVGFSWCGYCRKKIMVKEAGNE